MDARPLTRAAVRGSRGAWLLRWLAVAGAVLALAASPATRPAWSGTASAVPPPAAASAPAEPGPQARGARLDEFNPARPEPPEPSAASDPQTQQAYHAALRAYYAYRAQGYEHRRLAFEWQSWSSKGIFFVVLLLVFAGIAFAALQFGAGMRQRRGAPDTSTELVIDLKGIQVKSPVLGVVVLALSLAFFYLYLVYVYPIVNVF